MEGNTYINLFGSNDAVTLTSGDVVGAYGGNNTIITGGDNLVYVSQTNGAFDNVRATGDTGGGTTVTGQGTGVVLAINTQVNVNGNGNAVYLSTGDSLGAYGGSNTINVAADDDVYVSQTNGAFDALIANNDVGGLPTANGQVSGITLSGDAQANLFGSGNTVNLSTGDSLGAYGGSNTINSGAGNIVYVAGTNGLFDTVNANGDAAGGITANGQGTGIVLADNAQADIIGSGDTISAGAGGFTGVFGNNDALTATGSAASFTGTNDTGNLNNTAVYEGVNTSVNIVGSGDAIYAGASDFTGVFGNNDGLTATGGSASFTGTNDTGSLNGTTVYLGDNSSVSIGGNYDTISAGTNDSSSVTGSNDTYYASSGSVGITGSSDTAAVNDTTVYVGDNSSIGVSGSYDTVHAGTNDSNSLTGTNDSYTSFSGAVGVTGSADTLNVNDTTVYVGDNSSIGVSGSYDTVHAGTNDSNSLTGTNDSYTSFSGAVGVTGSADTLNVNDTTVYVGDNSSIGVSGSYDTVYAGNNDINSLTGTYDTYTAYSGTVGATGSSDTLNVNSTTVYEGDNSSIGVSGSGHLDLLEDYRSVFNRAWVCDSKPCVSTVTELRMAVFHYVKRLLDSVIQLVTARDGPDARIICLSIRALVEQGPASRRVQV